MGREMGLFRGGNEEEEWKGLEMEKEWKKGKERKGKWRREGTEWNLGRGKFVSLALVGIDAPEGVSVCVSITIKYIDILNLNVFLHLWMCVCVFVCTVNISVAALIV